jgi:hypothetical protein
MIDASTRLRRAIVLCDGLLVKRIIRSNPGILQNPDFKDKSNTSLHLAAQVGFEEIVVRTPFSPHPPRLLQERKRDTQRPILVTRRNSSWMPGMKTARYRAMPTGIRR